MEPTPSNMLAYIASVMGFLGLVSSLVPRRSWSILEGYVYRFFSRFTFYVSLRIQEYAGGTLNVIYEDAEVYVASLIQGSSAMSLQLSLAKNVAKPTFALSGNERLKDYFEGSTFWWSHQTKEMDSTMVWRPTRDEKRHFTLELHHRARKEVLPKYLKFVSERAKVLRHENKEKLMYTNTRKDDSRGSKRWSSVPFLHPATFECMAMESHLKNKVQSDLRTFMDAEAFYKKVGRAWKRGYLLYGPPGTGKSSLIAAIANFTGYDIYDLELTEVSSNAELRSLLMDVSSKSIIVIEDIDCTIELKKRGNAAPVPADDEEHGPMKKKSNPSEEQRRVTLSGLLNFTDGLWSSCGTERIIIFTTNYIEKIDPALIRSGRMDLHIHMTYCTFEAFKVLVSTHLGIEKHELYKTIQELFDDPHVVPISPADVAEVLIQNRTGGAKITLQALIGVLKDPNRKPQSSIEAKNIKDDEVS